MTSIRAFAGVFAVVLTGFGCAASAEVVDEPGASTESAARRDCSTVRCAQPLCSDTQHLEQNTCCPVCVDNGNSGAKCATIMCAAVACAEGEQRVTSPGDCCGHCVKTPTVAECIADLDCPSYACIACPCPTSECIGRKCVTKTADASTCGTP